VAASVMDAIDNTWLICFGKKHFCTHLPSLKWTRSLVLPSWSRKGELILNDRIGKQHILPTKTTVQFVTSCLCCFLADKEKPYFPPQKALTIRKLKPGPSL